MTKDESSPSFVLRHMNLGLAQLACSAFGRAVRSFQSCAVLERVALQTAHTRGMYHAAAGKKARGCDAEGRNCVSPRINHSRASRPVTMASGHGSPSATRPPRSAEA